jgi:sugar phosphate isomerase/epimerase
VRLGMLTSPLPGLPLQEVARWAAYAGYEALEVAAWPGGPTGPGAASHLDPAAFGAADAGRVRADSPAMGSRCLRSPTTRTR